jgi:DNA-binding XRE family transcriptional regulator
MRVTLKSNMRGENMNDILQQQDFLKQYIKDKSVYEKLLSYFSRHELIGEEIFPYLGEIGNDFISYGGERFSYRPVTKEVFINRIPFYFYKSDKDNDKIGNLNQYIMGILRDGSDMKDFDMRLEHLYATLEIMFYRYKIDLEIIFEYPIVQTGYISRTDVLFKWVHYLELAEHLNLMDKTPKHLIVDYNYALEKSGLEPVIYELEEQFDYQYINRTGNVFELKGTFPCDENGQPILRWIGVKINNAIKIWTKVDKRLKGTIHVEAQPKTSIWGLNCWGNDDDGSDVWYQLYIGPQLMQFDSQALKHIRNREKLTQQQVSDAIGASVRTYQKWESGNTTPDSHHLLRLMNVLDIRDTRELTVVAEFE